MQATQEGLYVSLVHDFQQWDPCYRILWLDNPCTLSVDVSVDPARRPLRRMEV